jgi:hypothetical protein
MACTILWNITPDWLFNGLNGIISQKIELFKITEVPLLVDTISHRVSDLWTDIQVILNKKKINLRRKFSLQMDERVDYSGHAQLTAIIRHLDEDISTDQFFSRSFQSEQASWDISCYWRMSSRKWIAVEGHKWSIIDNS